MSGFYHQDEQDAAVGLGFMGLVAIGVVVACVVVCTIAACAADDAKEHVVAGLNAVTAEEALAGESDQSFRDEWDAGAWSVTLEDLEREPEPGTVHPSNGKNAALDANTTVGRGAGMVDLVTYDISTGVATRHYGQVTEDGSIRWYGVETVVDGNGQPVTIAGD